MPKMKPISNDLDIDANGMSYGRNSKLGRNPSSFAGDQHSGGHMSQGVYNDASPPDANKGGNLNGSPDARIWKGFGKPLPGKTWK